MPRYKTQDTNKLQIPSIKPCEVMGSLAKNVLGEDEVVKWPQL